MNWKTGIFLLTAGTLLTSGVNAYAIDAHPDTVEVTVVLDENGDVQITNRIAWDVLSGTMGAFYFQGAAVKPIGTFYNAYVDRTDSQKRTPLKITKVDNNKWDIVASPRIPSGISYWNFTYKGNMIDQKYIGRTSSPEYGELYYFDWAPVQWDEKLRYRDIKIVLPIELESATVDEDTFYRYAGYHRSDDMNSGSKEAIILTEKYMNYDYKIDYIATDIGNHQYHLTMHVYQDSPRAMQSQRIQFYIKKMALNLQTKR